MEAKLSARCIPLWRKTQSGCFCFCFLFSFQCRFYKSEPPLKTESTVGRDDKPDAFVRREGGARATPGKRIAVSQGSVFISGLVGSVALSNLYASQLMWTNASLNANTIGHTVLCISSR